jgi:hypothetical protein
MNGLEQERRDHRDEKFLFSLSFASVLPLRQSPSQRDDGENPPSAMGARPLIALQLIAPIPLNSTYFHLVPLNSSSAGVGGGPAPQSQTRLPPRRRLCYYLRLCPVGTVPSPIRAPEGMFDLESLAAFSGSAVVSTASVGVPPAESFVQNWPAYWVSPQAHRL